MIPFLEKKKREKKKIIGVLTLFDGLNVFKLCWKVLDQESGKIKTGGGGGDELIKIFDGLQIFLKPSLDRHDIASTVGNELCLQKKKKMVDNRFRKQRIH